MHEYINVIYCIKQYFVCYTGFSVFFIIDEFSSQQGKTLEIISSNFYVKYIIQMKRCNVQKILYNGFLVSIMTLKKVNLIRKILLIEKMFTIKRDKFCNLYIVTTGNDTSKRINITFIIKWVIYYKLWKKLSIIHDNFIV